MIRVGKQNLITDVPGIKVGNFHDEKIRTGVTVIIPEEPAIASADIRGGGPGTRETDALNSDCLVDVVHGIVMSGGSAYGLDAAGGVMAYLREHKIGFILGDAIIPIVPSAILFDLLNGGDKDWAVKSPYYEFGYKAAENVSTDFDLGNIGAGYGAVTGGIKGGLGSASFVFSDDGSEITVGAIAAVNSMGSLTMPGSPTMWAFPYEQDNELGNQPMPEKDSKADLDYSFELPTGKNTTLVTVATDAALTKPQARRVAIMAQDGMARAIRPVHSPFDGDSVFVLSTGKCELSDPVVGVSRLGMLAADCVARAIARGGYQAQSLGDFDSYRDRYGS
ncbi:MAG: P1 family peptidase [Desulfobacteraceae bacterium]|nr:P1 family peptidase [Desulfobacteraceae bacterium]